MAGHTVIDLELIFLTPRHAAKCTLGYQYRTCGPWHDGRQLWLQTSGCELCLRVHTVQQEAQKNIQYKHSLKCEQCSVSVIIMFVRISTMLHIPAAHDVTLEQPAS